MTYMNMSYVNYEKKLQRRLYAISKITIVLKRCCICVIGNPQS
jgi:hypothetical protein